MDREVKDPQNGLFFTVTAEVSRNILRDHLLHGYETQREFENALRELIRRWRGRVGERIDERHDFFLLRFHDTPGGKPDEEWMPRYLLQNVAMPEYLKESEAPDEMEEELNRAFGFI
jgi:hypothetical protein